jgi:hypothetical protein
MGNANGDGVVVKTWQLPHWVNAIAHRPPSAYKCLWSAASGVGGDTAELTQQAKCL